MPEEPQDNKKLDDDDVVVLCRRAEDGPSLIYGCTREKCYQCGKKVWLSPATRSTVERESQTYKILCLQCGEKRLRDHPSSDDKLMPLSKEQVRELFKGLTDLN
jgi:hypothetical protein